MSAAAVSERTEDTVVLGDLYGENKSLSLAIGAALTLGRRPQVETAVIERHLAECERAVAERPGELAEHFEACRAAAADLAAMVREVDRDRRTPSRQRLGAVRASHRRLRRLVWEVFDCEYVPCGHERSH
jgi:hypothetical protein